jgi:predicted DNA-binding antitoxin AbrB/MazE fold protein
MSQTIHAVYENGLSRPTEKVELPSPCEVEVEVRQVSEAKKKKKRMK